MWEKPIGIKGYNLGRGSCEKQGFTLIELLVVIAIIALLMAILLPALDKARQQVRAMQCIRNQREIVNALTFFATDNDGQYPESVATVGFGAHWNWNDPRKLIGNRTRAPALYRAMSEYLRSYIKDAGTLFCPNAPNKYKYLQQSWDAGDEWNNPETSFPFDPVGGTYCFYFNYIGYLGPGPDIFRGPQGPSGGPKQSSFLVTDYFGYDCWQSPNAYGSCERFNGSSVVEETWLLSAYWSRAKSDTPINIKLNAGYTDGHVESFKASEVVPMRVSKTSDGSVPYPDGVGPGIFYLPINGLR